jgi:branched-chain amino acid transport system substrate-binding protein
MTRKALFLLALVVCLSIALVVGGCADKETGPAEDKDEIVIGAARSYTGPLSIQDVSCFGPVYRMWIDEVNERGGIYVEEYGKKLPVRLIKYDDTSDMNTMTNLLKKLMVEDQVDFVLAPISTAFLKAAAQICNDHGYILIGAEGGAKELEPLMAEMPYFFSLLNYATHQAAPLVDLLKEHGIESAAIIYIEDQHGIEYRDDLVPLLEQAGIELVYNTSIPLGIQDVSAIIEEVKAKKAQALLCCAYPDENFGVMNECMAADYNPDVLLFGPGACFEVFYNIYGEATEGVMGWGAWNENSSTALKDLAERLIAHQGERNMDWWGMAIYYAGLQVLEQAIEKAGTLDHDVLKDVIATEKFDTVIGELWFENGGVPAECYPGQVGQWQDGIFEVVAPSDKTTADPMIPKPKWPSK